MFGAVTAGLSFVFFGNILPCSFCLYFYPADVIIIMYAAVIMAAHTREETEMMIAMTGVSGNMGREALMQTLELDFVDRVKVLLTPKKRNDALVKKLKKRYGDRVEAVRGSVSDPEACRALVEGTDVVVNMAAVIPPASDRDPRASYECNQIGAMRLTDAVAAMPKQAKLIHTSTVAVYGNRTLAHPWGRPGDPLLPAAYDNYAMHKMIAERYVMESSVRDWAVLRQTAMLYDGIIFANVSDGLMFHTTLNGPLEWVTARDSGYLIRRIIECEHAGDARSFWNKVYDITGGALNRRTGYDTFAAGFGIMGGSPESYCRPDWFQTRNFHGLWYADGELNDMFGYVRDSFDGFWSRVGHKYRIFRLARMLPPALIRALVFKRLLKDGNSPRRWIKDGSYGRVFAAFGRDVADGKPLPSRWEDFTLERASDYGSDEQDPSVTFKSRLLDHGYDESKPQEEWTLADMCGAAGFRGGKCLSKEYSSPREKLLWQCSEGHTFSAAPYTVLKGGHWCPFCQPQPWNFDRLAARSPFYAQVWYDSHSRDENASYRFGDDGAALFDFSEDDR